MRFALVGGVSFVIDFGLLIVFREFVFSSFRGGVIVSQALSFTISLIIHYFLASFWVFRDHDTTGLKAHAKVGGCFVFTNVIGLGINELCLGLGTLLADLNYIYVKLGASIIVMLWNYFSQKLFVFRFAQGRENMI